MLKLFYQCIVLTFFICWFFYLSFARICLEGDRLWIVLWGGVYLKKSIFSFFWLCLRHFHFFCSRLYVIVYVGTSNMIFMRLVYGRMERICVGGFFVFLIYSIFRIVDESFWFVLLTVGFVTGRFRFLGFFRKKIRAGF